jgi:hypothetical protein
VPSPLASPEVVVVPIGTPLAVRITDVLRSDRIREGTEFQALLDEPLSWKGFEIALASAAVRGRVDGVGPPGQRPFLELSLTEMNVRGGPVPIRTGLYRLIAPPPERHSGVRTILVGAGAGAAIGAALGGKKGATAGAAAGALLAGPPDLDPTVYSFGSRLTSKLAESLTVTRPR